MQQTLDHMFQQVTQCRCNFLSVILMASWRFFKITSGKCTVWKVWNHLLCNTYGLNNGTCSQAFLNTELQTMHCIDSSQSISPANCMFEHWSCTTASKRLISILYSPTTCFTLSTILTAVWYSGKGAVAKTQNHIPTIVNKMHSKQKICTH